MAPLRRRSPVTLTPETIVAPCCFAPLTSACTRSLGLTWPSLGVKAAQTRSSTAMPGTSSPASSGVMICTSSPWAAAVAPEPGGLAGLGFEALVERDRIGRDAGEAHRGAQLAHGPAGVPCRPGRGLVLLEQNRVLPAEPGQMVGGAAAHHAAADDDGAGGAGNR